MNDDLIRRVAEVERAVTPAAGWPSAWPAPHQCEDQWRAEVAQLRGQHDAMALEACRLAPPVTDPVDPDAVEVSFVRVPMTDGSWQGAKVYRPTAARGPLPAVLLLHGGGWWMGGGAAGYEIGAPLCRRLAEGLEAIVVAFDYRLAPEHRFPTALDDVEAAVAWIVGSADLLGVDPARVGVLGNSSGGNLAAALCRRMRGTERALAFQVLHVPALDLRFDSRSARRTPGWSEQGAILRSLYLPPDVPVDHPEVSPVLATEFDGLPPAVIVVGRHDQLRDDGVSYDAALRGAGVDSVLLEYEMTHTVAAPGVSSQWVGDVVAHVRPLLDVRMVQA